MRQLISCENIKLMVKFDIISLGAAVQDVFLGGKVLTPKHEKDGWVEEFPLGAKLDLDSIEFATGGGATNAAVTFARQGMSSALMGKIGVDPAGSAVKTALMQDEVDIKFLTYSEQYKTGYSVLLLAPNGERTILTYRGASTHYELSDFKLDQAEADWLYLSSMSGKMEILEKIVNEAHSRGMKIACNPGKGELKYTDRLIKLLPKMTLLNLNKEEMMMLVDSEQPEQIMRAIASFVDYAVMTDGPNGSWATDGKKLVKAGMYKDVDVADRTGAGDAFSSGFTASIARGKGIEHAVTFASANSTGVVQHIGAKKGILHADAELEDMDLTVTQLS